MKRNTFVLGLMLASLLTGLSSHKTYGQSNQNDTGQTKTSKRVYDIDGKRIRADEKYVAERMLKNGRIIGYRQNKREVTVLVKALKEDGITDERLLDPKFWMMLQCIKYDYSCYTLSNCNGTCKAVTGPAERANVRLFYCYCP